MTNAPLISVRGMTRKFPGVLALRSVDFELRAGEIHALVGENGSGKSTLCKCLYGLQVPDAGSIEMDGSPVEIRSPHRALQLGIVAITQELTLAPTLSVTENVLMGRLPRGPFGVDWKKARKTAREALEQVGAEIDERALVGSLSIELQQEVEIARAVSAKFRVLILDESTSSLSEAATGRLLSKLRQLRDQGVGIIFVSHRLREVYACADRATILRDGELQGVVPLPSTSESELVRRMVGRTMQDLYHKRLIKRGNPVLEVRDLHSRDGFVQGVSFDAHEGEILGIAGLVGSGKVRLGEAIFGAVRAEGEVRVGGERVRLGNPRRSIAAGIGFVPDDRKGDALLLTRSVKPNLSLPWVQAGPCSSRGILQMGVERSMCEDSVRQLSIRTPALDFPVVQLSGGNQQKVVLARWFALEPRVVILSEPTRGIDVGAKSEVYGYMQDLAEKGVGIIMISSELPELLGVADRILVMFQGRICGEFDPKIAGEEDIAHAACVGSDLLGDVG